MENCELECNTYEYFWSNVHIIQSSKACLHLYMLCQFLLTNNLTDDFQEWIAYTPVIIEILSIRICVKGKQTGDHISQMRLSSSSQKNNGKCPFKMITANSGRFHVFHVIRSFRLSSISTNTQIALSSQVNSPGHFDKGQISIPRKSVFDIFERNPLYYLRRCGRHCQLYISVPPLECIHKIDRFQRPGTI